MNRRNVVRLALAAALFGAAVPGAALAQGQGKWWTPRGENQQQQRFHRDLFEGRWVARDRNDTNGRGGFGRGWNRGMVLPNLLTIDQGRGMVRVADGRNNLLQVIATGQGSSRLGRERATLLTGELRGNQLVATGTDERGRPMHQVMTVRDGGRTLVIRTQVQRGNSGRVVQVEKVYQRA